MEPSALGRLARGAVVRLAVIFASVAVTLLGLEAGLRCCSDREAPLLVKDAVFGHLYEAGFSGYRFVPEANRRILLRFNRLGYRGPDRPTAKPEGVRRIAVLGDSFTAAVQVEEPDTMAARLEQRLNASSQGRRWEVLNFGIGGYSTAQSLLTWRHVARQFHPDIVLLCFFDGNDLWDNHSGLTSYLRPYFTLNGSGALVAEPFSPWRVSASDWFNRHSLLYVWQKEKIRAVRDQWHTAGQNVPPVTEVFDPAPPPPYPQAWEVTERLIATLADEVRASGAEFLLVQIAAPEEYVDEYWNALVNAVGPAKAATLDRTYPATRLGRLAARGNFAILPLAGAFRGAPDPTALHFSSGGHWTAAGNHLAAETIFGWLQGRAVVRSPPS